MPQARLEELRPPANLCVTELEQEEQPHDRDFTAPIYRINPFLLYFLCHSNKHATALCFKWTFIAQFV